MIGTTLGPYEVLAKLGEGGMGEVYRATDINLKRSVAIKVLPASVAGDTDRLARFQREAEVLAALNHPNIAAIYGLEKTPDCTALVMELVEGEDLSRRIARGAIPIDEALPIAKQIADALEAAHGQGIIHRDLKPANIQVRGDGTVKVLDFGLAKAIEAGGGSERLSMSPTIASPVLMSAVGVILGTAAYMAPEQARGKVVDKRADIWAFGVVLFEMLSGKPPFPGDDVTQVLARVIEREPDWAALPATTPSAIRRLLRRCLDKDLSHRLRDIGDARLELELDGMAGRSDDVPVVDRSRWREIAPWLVAAGLAAALTISLVRVFAHAPPDSVPVRRFTLAIPPRSAPNWNDFDVAISPDGAQLAYTCREGNTVSICVHPLDGLTVRRVADGRDADEWAFSPDGEWLGIADEVGLSKVSIRGGPPQPILRWSNTQPATDAFAWGPDNSILFGSASGIQRVSAAGGPSRPVTQIAPDSVIAGHYSPSILPDGRTALVTIARRDGNDTGGLVNLADGTVRDLGLRGNGFVYLPPGWLAFKQGSTVLAAAFDLRDPTRLATPVPVLENVRSRLRLARDGSLVYIPTRGDSNARLVWVDRAGRPTPAETQRLDYTHLDLAVDGRRALLNLIGGEIDLIDLQTGTRKSLVRGGFPIWSSKGDRVTFEGASGIEWAPADGSGQPETLVSHSGFVVPTSWNSVTGDLAYYDHHAFEIWIRSADGKTRRFLGAPGRKRSGRFSPDGKWLAFVSDETKEYQVYVTAYPGPGPIVPVSTKGGLSPIWSADGHELFFRLGEKVMAARMTSQSPLAFTVPVELFDGPYTLDLMGHQREAIAADGKRFLMVENSDDFPIVFVQNWAAELGRLVRGR